jgi:GT2 family glycosyltransferase
MDDGIRISAIIPTFNRPNALQNCVESLLRQTLNPRMYEIIIVDNNSSDATREALNGYLKLATHNVIYVCEPRQGLHFARHAGAKAAHSEILAFTDDDAVCDEHWLEELLAAFQEMNVGCAGGKIIINWDREPPSWIIPYEAVLGRLNYGPEPLILKSGQLINGGNLAIRRTTLKDLGGFNPDQVGEVLIGDGEVGLCYKAHRAGIKIAWVPSAVVWHCQTVGKNATLLDLKRRFSNNGVAAAYSFYQGHHPTRLNLLGSAAASFRAFFVQRLLILRNRLAKIRDENYEQELSATYLRAKASWELKFLFRERCRKYAAKQNWWE